MASDNVKVFTDSNFDETVLKSAQPVLVDFWAEWCAPCRRLGPTVDALAADFDGRASIGKVNVDENPTVTMRYSIRGIPTLLLFKNGELVDQIVGLAEKEHLTRLIEQHL